MSDNQHTPLWRQLLGAAIGSVVALLLYGGFVTVSPNLSTLTAYLSSTFEGKIEHLPIGQRSPRTIREDVLAQREVLGNRARAATARLLSSSSSSSSFFSVVPVASVIENQQEAEAYPKKATAPTVPEKQNRHRLKRQEEKLPSTGVPLWAVSLLAFCLTMSIRYHKELLGNH